MRKSEALLRAALLAGAVLALTGCNGKVQAGSEALTGAGAPPAVEVVHEGNAGIYRVDHPEQFALVTAGQHAAAPSLEVTGTVTADVSRNVPVVSLASGRILRVHARLGDTVSRGQLLLEIQSPDISQALADYQQALADRKLAKAQYDRARLLLDRGAIAQKDLEIAEDTETKAGVMVANTLNRLRILGADPDHPSPIVEIHAPVSGVITDQQVTAASGTQGLASPNAFTISDISRVWILCDVYENDLAGVRVGQAAEIRLNAYPGRVMQARISNISPIMDPAVRTAKVRLEVANPGILRFGMFVTARFQGQVSRPRTVVPASSILHLHDLDWVYVPAENGQFRRVEVTAGDMLPDEQQEITAGIAPGQRLVRNALTFQNTVEQ